MFNVISILLQKHFVEPKCVIGLLSPGSEGGRSQLELRLGASLMQKVLSHGCIVTCSFKTAK